MSTMDEKVTLDELEKGLGLQEKKDIITFRNYWSPRIFWLVFGILIFQGAFIMLIGLGYLDYINYKNVISVYLGESVIQVFGLGIIVLKFLFPNNKNRV